MVTPIPPDQLAAAVTAELTRRDNAQQQTTNSYYWCAGTTTYHVWDYRAQDGDETYVCRVCGFSCDKSSLKRATDHARPKTLS